MVKNKNIGNGLKGQKAHSPGQNGQKGQQPHSPGQRPGNSGDGKSALKGQKHICAGTAFALSGRWRRGHDTQGDALGYERLAFQAVSAALGYYWNVQKYRHKKDGIEKVTNCHQLKLLSADGKMRLTDVALG